MKVLSQGSNSVTIEVTPDSLGVDTVKVGRVSYLNFSFMHALAELNSNGSYLRQFIPILVGVFSKQIQVQVLSTDYTTLSQLPPDRSPRVRNILIPRSVSEFVSYDLPFEQRRHIASRIRVYPFSYDSSSGSYKFLKRVIFQVSSVGSSVTTQNVGTDPLLSQTLINYPQVRNAVVSRPPQLLKTTASSLLALGSGTSFPFLIVEYTSSHILRLRMRRCRSIAFN